MRPLADRFWEKVDRSGACWPWTASLLRNGYGRIGAGRRGTGYLLAHRVAWELSRGPIPAGMVIDHLCRNRACVNPDHLEVVTHRINLRRGAHPNMRRFREIASRIPGYEGRRAA